MPLQFESLSHGKIAFGFFNIETDMILLNQYFLFAEDFCHHISKAARIDDEVFETSWEVYSFQNQEDIGNLMAAISGFDHRGFMGEVYKLFPFPKKPEDFKQKPEGNQTRPLMKRLIEKYGEIVQIPFELNLSGNRVRIGEYLFSPATFRKLIQYIWRGGLPGWRGGMRPQYVWVMKETAEKSRHPLFSDLFP